MSEFVDSMMAHAKMDKQTIVLPEGDDARVLEAASIVLKEGVADVIVLGDAKKIAESGFDLDGAHIVDPITSEKHGEYAEALCELRKRKGMRYDEAYELVNDPIYYGTMMVKMGDADGMVAGACHSTSHVLRACLQILKTAPGVKYVSSFFVMVVPDCEYGENGAFIFSDCGLEIQPDADMLSQIAINASRSWTALFDSEPRVAMLSHSTRGSAALSDDLVKVQTAVKLVKEEMPDLIVDGEMQLDAAIVPSVASSKAPDSEVAGRANVLIFPDLDAGNIGYKLVQRLAKAEAYGPITQGLAAPVNDLSRGCDAWDIAAVVSITCVQCQAQKALRAKAEEDQKSA